MTDNVVVVGTGGFGRETLDVLTAMNAHGGRQMTVLGVVDDAPSEMNLRRLNAFRVPYLGCIGEWLSSCASGKYGNAKYLVAVGNPVTRRRIVAAFDVAGCRPAVAIHPTATVGTGSRVGPGSVICGGVQISTNVRLGAHVHLNPNATIGHDAVLDDFVSINPAATISGECSIESGALVGAAATVLQRLTVGRGAVVGAAACVVRDVAGGSVVKGVPAQ